MPCASFCNVSVLQGQCKAEWTLGAAKSLLSLRKCHQRVMWSQVELTLHTPFLSLSWSVPRGTWRALRLVLGMQVDGSACLLHKPANTCHILEYFKTTLNYAKAYSGLWPGKSCSNQSRKMPHSDISLSCPQLNRARPWHRWREGLGRWWPLQNKYICWAALGLWLQVKEMS